MHTGILATKLFPPPNRANWVARPRLLQKLNNGLRSGCKLAMVSAPAGSGKTTLVAGWTASLRSGPDPVKVAWLSLDPGDNDLSIFLSYVLAALHTCAPTAGEVTGHLLEQSPLPGLETLLLPLVNDLARLDGQNLLVLDDYHLIQLPAIHEALAFLVEYQPPNMQIVLTTRQDPLLPLARWRARGLLTEVRLRELRFSGPETAVFLNQATGFELRAEDIAALENRTEGWIAGLQLAAISLLQSGAAPGDASITGFVESFTGNDRFVMDYLVDEVLSLQPEPVKHFLLQTACLERFNAGLCEAVLEVEPGGADGAGERSAGSILEYLDRANLFLIPLDHQREWYRYHHLFAELLQYRLQETSGKMLATRIRQRASQWFDEQGLANEALSYANAAADWDSSCRLVEKYGPFLMQRGDQATVRRWLSAIPEEILRGNPVLCSYYGYTLTVTGKLDQGESYLRLAEQALPGDANHMGSTLAFASYNACFRGDFAGEIELSRRALELLPPENFWIRGLAAVSLGLGLCHAGDPQGCETAMKQALAAGKTSRNPRTCVHALTYLGRISVLRLDFQQAEAYFRLAIDYQSDGQSFHGVDIPLFDLAQLKYEQNDLQRMEEYMEKGLEANRRTGSIEMLAYGYRIKARLHQLRGERDAAQEYLKKAVHLAGEYNLSPLTLSLNAAFQVETAVAEGNLREARLASANIGNSQGLFTFNFYPEIARARLHLAQGEKREVFPLLAPALPIAEQPGWEYPRLQVRVLQAMAETDPARARLHLREALVLAERGGAMRTFLDLGAPLQALLLELRPFIRPSESAFADALLAAFQKELGNANPAATQQPGNESLVEPLSEREIEVLRLLADGLTNAEIAQRLYLSPNTLKAHTQNIYSKLDVHSRVQAVNRARELGL
jgi:LuxR family maltose regulon positive regulatory protein